MQQELQKEDMLAQVQDLEEDPNLSDTQDGDVQLLEAPKLDQPKFMTPLRGDQGITVAPTILSWLSSSINKK